MVRILFAGNLYSIVGQFRRIILWLQQRMIAIVFRNELVGRELMRPVKINPHLILLAVLQRRTAPIFAKEAVKIGEIVET